MRSVRSPSRSSAAVRPAQSSASVALTLTSSGTPSETMRGRGMIGRQAVVQEHGAECNGNGQKQGDQGDL